MGFARSSVAVMFAMMRSSYADSAHGACVCTHIGEMTIRAGTARPVVLYLKRRLSLEAAADEAVADLGRLRGGQLSGVVIHAIDPGSSVAGSS